MPTILSDSIRQIGAIWQRLSNPSRVAVAATLVLAVGGLLLVTFWARTPSFVVLESDLDTARASQIVDALEGLDVEFETRDGGRTILVPAGDVGRLRIKLAGRGITMSGDVPEEEADSPWVGSDERQAKRIRRLQTEIARTLEGLKGIHRVRVMISPAKDSVYGSRNLPPKASVTVWPEAGRTLAAYQVEGIVSATTNSVPGLTPENVTVVDGEGRRMTRRRSGSDDAITDDAIAHRDAYRRGLEETASRILDGAVGPGRYRLAVFLQMSFDTKEIKKTDYDNEGKVVMKETSKKETTPSVSSGSADGTTVAPAKTEEKDREYMVPKTETMETQMTPRVDRVSAGIVIDSNHFQGKIEDLEKVLASALGIQKPEDLSIRPIPFAEIPEPEPLEDDSPFDLGGIIQLIQYAAAGLVGLGLLIFFRGAFRRSPESMVPARTGAHLDLTVGDEDLPEDRVPPKVIERQRLKKEIARAIDQDPRGVAKLIEMWLHEEGA